MTTRKDLAAVAATAYWTETDAQVAITAWQASGQSIAAFARTHRIGAQRLRWWSRRLGEPSSERGPRMVPIEVVATHESAPTAIEIAVGRFAVRVATGCDAATLRRVVEVLSSC